jgi:hypothetical protein
MKLHRHSLIKVSKILKKEKWSKSNKKLRKSKLTKITNAKLMALIQSGLGTALRTLKELI